MIVKNRFTFRLLPWFLGLLLSLQFSSPRRADATDLITVMEQAFLHDATYLSTLEEIAARKIGTWQSWSAMGPTVDISAERGINKDFLRSGVEPQDISERYYENRLRAVLQQPVFDLGKFIRLKRDSVERKKITLLEKQAKETLILRVAERYFSVLDAQDALQLAEAERSTLEKQAAFAIQRHELGVGTVIDRHDAEARYHLAQAREIAARDAVQESWSHLDEWLRSALQGDRFLLPLKKTESIEPLYGSPEVWVEKAHQNNASLNLRILEAELLDYDRMIRDSAHLPTLSLNLEHVYTDASGGLEGYATREREYTYSLQANLPLFRSGGNLMASLRARKEHLAAEDQVEAERYEIERDTKSAWRTAKTNQLLAQALFEAVEAGKKAVEAKEIGYIEGANTSLDVIDAQRIYYQDLREYQETHYQYILAYLELKKLIGELAEEDLENVNAFLEG